MLNLVDFPESLLLDTENLPRDNLSVHVETLVLKDDPVVEGELFDPDVEPFDLDDDLDESVKGGKCDLYEESFDPDEDLTKQW